MLTEEHSKNALEPEDDADFDDPTSILRFWRRRGRFEVSLARRTLDHLVGFLLAATTLAVLISSSDIGFARDEGFYFKAAKDYLRWFEELERNIETDKTDASFTQENIDQHWSYNPEHPALLKSLFALSYRSFSQERKWLPPSTAMRLPAMVFVAVLIWLMYVFMAEAFSRVAGLFACGALMTMPRVFFHAHMAAFDAPMMTMWFFVLYAYWRSTKSHTWVWLTALIFGIALSTKLNAFFLPALLVMHWGIAGWSQFYITTDRSRGRRQWMLHTPKVPMSFFAMALVSPFVFYLLWPRHWFDSFNRVAWYVERHLAHEHYAVYYFNEMLKIPPFPMEFPFVMSGYTIPLITLATCFVGWLALGLDGLWGLRTRFVWQRLKAALAGPLTRDLAALAMAPFAMRAQGFRPAFRASKERLATFREDGHLPQRPYPWDDRGTVLLMALGAFVPFAIIAKPSTPVFGGTKHWMTAMPYLACFAGLGVKWAFDRLMLLCSGWVAAFQRPQFRAAATLALVPVLLYPAFRETYHSNPNGTAYYNELMGGYVGAADEAMQRQFWGYSARQGLDWLNAHADQNSLVHFHDTIAYAVDMYKEEGLLREDIRNGWSLESSQYVMFHQEHAFYPFLFEIWATYKTQSPVFVASVDGVPVLSIYANPNWVSPAPQASPVHVTPVRRTMQEEGETPTLQQTREVTTPKLEAVRPTPAPETPQTRQGPNLLPPRAEETLLPRKKTVVPATNE
ncbi:MAG: hypothetical protein AUK47_23020 [Deltaproteobacteria bacterium CG2_30_63_29]|nr:MAG: hypothetical protein AUK47_23020 [Deltaproteobacteria bacterium CG2_30_63_29]PJB34804.1 MAG: hypothetical protein CO108_27170 [Deltaproteobacteria bacterium CG_4_9_14_3_um_filter_63_12]